MRQEKLQAPFPWFGGKRKVADLVWVRFGEVKNYVEPFYGSGAVLLGRPVVSGIETVNDLDGFVANFWRSVKLKPDETAEWADQPVNENDLHARHVWLLKQKERLSDMLCGDPDYCDPRVAGWWAWGISCWIGSGFCSGNGPWWPDETGALSKSSAGQGVNRQLPYLGSAGQGVNRQLPHLGNAGQGVNRQLPHLGNAGLGVNRLSGWFYALSERLRFVRVCSGDWSRVCGPSVTTKLGLTGVFLDPPYADTSNRAEGLYAQDSMSVAHDVREWAIENGTNPLLRIALCGYEGEHVMPEDWECVAWNAGQGYGSQKTDGRTENGKRERVWFSPACIRPGQTGTLL